MYHLREKDSLNFQLKLIQFRSYKKSRYLFKWTQTLISFSVRPTDKEISLTIIILDMISVFEKLLRNLYGISTVPQIIILGRYSLFRWRQIAMNQKHFSTISISEWGPKARSYSVNDIGTLVAETQISIDFLASFSSSNSVTCDFVGFFRCLPTWNRPIVYCCLSYNNG